MHYRPLGTLGVDVSEISLGCNRLGEKIETLAHWAALVTRALDLGVNLFDTAEGYGHGGGSERVLGEVIGNRERAMIATKIGGNPAEKDNPARQYAPQWIIERAEQCLRRLNRERIDVLQLHSPSLAAMQQSDWPEAFERLRQQGKVRWAGMAIDSAEAGRWLIERKLAQVLQVTYNILDRHWASELFELAETTGVALVARMPLCRGILTGKFAPGKPLPEGARARLTGDYALTQVEQAARLRPLAADYPGGPHHLAMHYALRPRAVSCVIPGARNIEQLEQNCAASNGGVLPDEMVEEIEAIVR